MLRGDGQINPDGVRDYDVLIPAEVEALIHERHDPLARRLEAEAETWRASFPGAGGAAGAAER
jgi:hypothetical protein